MAEVMPLRTNGDAIRKLRLLKGLTIVEFARLAEYSTHHVTQVELGHENAGPRLLGKASKILDCDIDDITDGLIPYGSVTKNAAENAAGAA